MPLCVNSTLVFLSQALCTHSFVLIYWKQFLTLFRVRRSIGLSDWLSKGLLEGFDRRFSRALINFPTRKPVANMGWKSIGNDAWLRAERRRKILNFNPKSKHKFRSIYFSLYCHVQTRQTANSCHFQCINSEKCICAWLSFPFISAFSVNEIGNRIYNFITQLPFARQHQNDTFETVNSQQFGFARNSFSQIARKKTAFSLQSFSVH